MIPVVFVGHGDYAEGVRNAAEMILGPQEHVASVALQPDGSTEGVISDVEAALDRLGAGEHEALVLADLMGGSPANAVSALALRHARLQLVSGLNLPMALEVLTSVEETAAALAEVALNAGRDGVLDVAARLRAAAAARK